MTKNTQIPTSGIDTRALSNLIIELNITRRNSRSYPEGHQIIDASLRKALNSYENLMETHDGIIVGVAHDALLVGDELLDKTNPIYRNFARVLYERGIGVLKLNKGLNIEELRSFIKILGLKRDEIFRDGGIDDIWSMSNISSLEIKAIRYDMFSTTEEICNGMDESPGKGENLWERFARGLTLGLLSPDGGTDGSLDPELLAGILNKRFNQGCDHKSNYAEAITNFLRESDIRQTGGMQVSVAYYQKLAAFVGKLNPDLRRQFLGCTFDAEGTGNRSMMEGIVRQLSTDVIIETMEDINNNQISVPPFVLGLLQQFGKHTVSWKDPQQAEPGDQGLKEKIRTIFKEQAVDEYIPESYQRKLQKMISSKEIPSLENRHLKDIAYMFDPAMMERRISDILLFLLTSGYPVEHGYSSMVKNISELCTYFLQTGDYTQLSRILRRLDDESIPSDTRLILKNHFSNREFLEEVLNGLNTWGKAKSDEISTIIREIGDPFIVVLLERLADEENMSLRRFMVDRLLEFGLAARTAIIEKLSDSRWYFVRNLIIMIRTLNFISATEKIRPLTLHSDQRVRQEALKTLLYFHDHEIEKKIISDMGSEDFDVKVSAIRIAEKCTSPDIFKKLIEMLTSHGLKSSDYTVRSAIVQTLGEIGNPEALPVLVGILSSWNILRHVTLNKLKLDVIRSLERYPPQTSRPVLERFSAGRGVVAQQASLSLRNLPGRQQ